MKVEMREDKHLWITLGHPSEDPREVIIDADRDVRICDGHTVVKVRFAEKKIRDVLVDDIFVWRRDEERKGLIIKVEDIKDVLAGFLGREPTEEELSAFLGYLEKDVPQITPNAGYPRNGANFRD